MAETKKGLAKDILITLMFLSFLVLAVTGILKFRRLPFLLNLSYDRLPMREISVVHEVAGLFLVGLIIIHLIFQYRWFGGLYQRIAASKNLFKILMLILVLFSLVWFGYTRWPSDEAKRLRGVEVRNYQGENLSSIASFRENSIKGPRFVDIDQYVLEIGGLVKKETSLTYDEILTFDHYEKVVTLNCVEGWSVKILWEGVLLKDLFGDNLAQGANTVIFYADDGYSSSLSLNYVLENDILLAYKMNGVTLSPERGFPFQVVAQDKWGYKWVKWVTRIELSDNKDFEGYWESAGYNKNGDLDGPKFESPQD